MKPRSANFLGPDKIDQEGDAFDYIRELRGYLWKFIRIAYPDAKGKMEDHIDRALGFLMGMREMAAHLKQIAERMTTIQSLALKGKDYNESHKD